MENEVCRGFARSVSRWPKTEKRPCSPPLSGGCYRGPYEYVVIVAARSIAQWPSLGACDPDYLSPDRGSYNPRTRPILRYWKARSADYAAVCATRSAAQTALRGHMTTADMAIRRRAATSS